MTRRKKIIFDFHGQDHTRLGEVSADALHWESEQMCLPDIRDRLWQRIYTAIRQL